MAAQRYSVAVLGLGMIGGSLALALKASDFAGRVLAWDRDPRALAAGLDAGVIDAACDGLDAALTADIAVVAVPNVAAAGLLGICSRAPRTPTTARCSRTWPA